MPQAMGDDRAVLSMSEHRDWLLGQMTPLKSRRVLLSDAFEDPGSMAQLQSCVLAADVLAAHNLPLWDNSAMDGYAVRAADTASAPVQLEVVDQIPAGSAKDPRLAPGQAVQIMTGAPIPTDADAVIRVEDTGGFDLHTVRINKAAAAGQDIRRAGEDRASGSPVALAGQRLTAMRLSAIAAAGVNELLVRPAPRIAVLITGAELRAPGQELGRGQIPESNSALITGLLHQAGLTAAAVVRCPDEPDEVRRHLQHLAAEHDAVISTGGVGPGEFDVMRQVLADEPAVRSIRVKIRPGQPQCAGRLRGGAMMFALPGNPVSAAVSFELFVLPSLRALQGHHRPVRPYTSCTAAQGWKSPAGRLQVLPVVFDEQGACLPAVAAGAISHSVGGFGSAQGYAVVDEQTVTVEPGDRVRVLRLHDD